MTNEYAGGLYSTQAARDYAAFADWITACGNNSDEYVADLLDNNSDEYLAAEAARDWQVDGADWLTAANRFRADNI